MRKVDYDDEQFDFYENEKCVASFIALDASEEYKWLIDEWMDGGLSWNGLQEIVKVICGLR